MKKISTKELYLCQLKHVAYETYDMRTTESVTRFHKESKYILARKTHGDE